MIRLLHTMHSSGSLALRPDHAAPMQNQFDSIDLSDNNVIILEGFPKLPRLKTLILNNNRITRISKHLEGKQPSRHLAITVSMPTVLVGAPFMSDIRES